MRQICGWGLIAQPKLVQLKTKEAKKEKKSLGSNYPEKKEASKKYAAWV